jgi:hypothetical protein
LILVRCYCFNLAPKQGDGFFFTTDYLEQHGRGLALGGGHYFVYAFPEQDNFTLPGTIGLPDIQAQLENI